MKTRCPHCQTIFRVSDAQLSAAQGKVRCGKCQQVFNAKEHISTEEAAEAAAKVINKNMPPPMPQVDWLQQDSRADDFDHIDLGISATDTDQREATASSSRVDSELDVDEVQASETDAIEIESTIEPFANEITAVEASDEQLTPAETDISPETAAPIDIEEEEIVVSGTGDDVTPVESSVIPGDIHDDIQEIEKDLSLPGITPAYEDDSYLNAREEMGLDNLQDEIQLQLETPYEEDATPDEVDAYTSVLDYLEDVSEQPDKTTAFENIELNAVPEEPSNAVNWDSAVHHDPEVPAALRSSMQALEEKKQRSPLLSTFMAIALFVLIADLGVQAIIFRSYDIATAWPQTRETLTLVCNYLPCVYSGRREPRRIQLVSRDVRVHPNAKHALLISATLVNQAGYAQPYPRLAVKLSDLSGDIVAEREFAPQEYLKASESRLKLLKPDVPTLITLEVLDPGSEAVNFEFRFL